MTSPKMYKLQVSLSTNLQVTAGSPCQDNQPLISSPPKYQNPCNLLYKQNPQDKY